MYGSPGARLASLGRLCGRVAEHLARAALGELIARPTIRIVSGGARVLATSLLLRRGNRAVTLAKHVRGATLGEVGVLLGLLCECGHSFGSMREILIEPKLRLE